MPEEIMGTTLDDVLKRESKVILELYSPSCSPCKKVEQQLKLVHEMLGDKVKVLKINIFKLLIMSIIPVVGVMLIFKIFIFLFHNIKIFKIK